MIIFENFRFLTFVDLWSIFTDIRSLELVEPHIIPLKARLAVALKEEA